MGRPTQCGNNLHQIGLAIHGFHDIHKQIPPARLDYDGGVTWCVLLLPYLEQGPFYKQWDLKQVYYQHPQSVRETQSRSTTCPSRRKPPRQAPRQQGHRYPGDHLRRHAGRLPGGLGDYAGSEGDNIGTYNTDQANGAFILAIYKENRPSPLHDYLLAVATRFANIIDGLMNTIFVGEKHAKLRCVRHDHRGRLHLQRRPRQPERRPHRGRWAHAGPGQPILTITSSAAITKASANSSWATPASAPSASRSVATSSAS